jgi:hypothetical protein
MSRLDVGGLSLKQGINITELAAQLQGACPKMLFVLNGRELFWLERKSDVPRGLCEEGSERSVWFHFRDPITGNRYCVFGQEAAAVIRERSGLPLQRYSSLHAKALPGKTRKLKPEERPQLVSLRDGAFVEEVSLGSPSRALSSFRDI